MAIDLIKKDTLPPNLLGQTSSPDFPCPSPDCPLHTVKTCSYITTSRNRRLSTDHHYQVLEELQRAIIYRIPKGPKTEKNWWYVVRNISILWWRYEWKIDLLHPYFNYSKKENLLGTKWTLMVVFISRFEPLDSAMMTGTSIKLKCRNYQKNPIVCQHSPLKWLRFDENKTI
jgi:hypothetical protein